MSERKTKRRAMWTAESLTGGLMLFASAKLAKKCAGGTKVTKLVESRPGDVVLSREDRDRLITLVNETARDEGRDADREALIVSLLRGGR